MSDHTSDKTAPTKPPVHVGDDAYEVGYGKPPEHSRFKKGLSGNPKGRPKAKKLLVYEDPIKTLLRQPIADAIDLSDKKMPLFMGLLKVLARMGLKSNTRAIQILINQTNGLNEIRDEQQREANSADEAYIQEVLECAKHYLDE